MPYTLLASLLASVLSIRFLLSADAYPRSKACVGVAWVVSLVLPHAVPSWALAGVLLQVVLVIGVLMHARVHARDRRTP